MAETETDQPFREAEDGSILVPLKLAHPMPEVYARRARMEDVKDYSVGDTVWVTREYGNALIDAGMVQVDPIDDQARQSALLLNRRNQPLTVKQIEQKFGGDAGAATAASAEKPQSAADVKSAAKK